MALRGKKPSKHDKRLKVLFFGRAGVGKTTTAIQFPKPYIIDTERGAENDSYVDAINAAGGAYLFSNDPDEIINEILSLLGEKHEYQTLVLDPLNVIYDALTDKGIEEHGMDFGRYKMPADRVMKRMLSLIGRLDMNVVVTCHAKDNWVKAKDAKGKDTVVTDGMTFDGYKKLDYLFDLVVEAQKRGNDRIGVVRKTRIQAFEEGAMFPLTYETFADMYGREVLERNAVPIALATPEQAERLEHMLSKHPNADALADKWRKAGGIETWNEMTAEMAAKCIKWLEDQANPAA